MARQWLNTLPGAVLLVDDELDDLSTRREHTIEEAAEALGDYVNNCQEWAVILAHAFPGLYGMRPLSEKLIGAYTDGSSARIKRYARRAHQGIQVTHPHDGDGSQEAGHAPTPQAQRQAAQGETTRREAEQPSARLLRELAACTAYALGATTTLPRMS